MKVNSSIIESIPQIQKDNKIAILPEKENTEQSKDKSKLLLGALAAMAVIGAGVILTRGKIAKSGGDINPQRGLEPPKAPSNPSLPSRVSDLSNISPGSQIKEFRDTHIIPADQKIVDGFMDGGRKAELNENNEIVNAGREVIVVDRAKDNILSECINLVKEKTKEMSEEDKMNFLYGYVCKLSGDPDKATKNSNILARGRDHVLLGDVFNRNYPVAVCRHRSLLFKILGDEVGLSVELQRGKYGVLSEGEFYGNGHAWNIVKLKNGKSLLVDTMQDRKVNLKSREARLYCSVNQERLYK